MTSSYPAQVHVPEQNVSFQKFDHVGGPQAGVHDDIIVIAAITMVSSCALALGVPLYAAMHKQWWWCSTFKGFLNLQLVPKVPSILTDSTSLIQAVYIKMVILFFYISTFSTSAHRVERGLAGSQR